MISSRNAPTVGGVFILSRMHVTAQKRALESWSFILVITDDQGGGDLGHHGNTIIRMPLLDQVLA
ncbi:hypothetical protein OAK97_01760 [bacterium]|nr:hypothetical protein [bacterium]